MKISVTSNFTGANLYTPQSAIIYSVDVKPHVGSYEDSLDPAFFSALFEKLPALQARIGELPGNWAQDRASLAHLFMHAAVELQTTVGCEIGPDKIRPTPSAGVYDVIFGYEDAAVGSAAGSLAATLIQHLLPEGESAEEDARPDFDFASTLERFTQSNQRRVMNLEQRYIVNAARARGIPAEHVGDGLVVFGKGRFQMRRLRHFNDHTSHLSFVLSSNKATTNRILGEIGLPVPEVCETAEEWERTHAQYVR